MSLGYELINTQNNKNRKQVILPDWKKRQRHLLDKANMHHPKANSKRKKERKKSLTRGHLKDIGSTVGIHSYP